MRCVLLPAIVAGLVAAAPRPVIIVADVGVDDAAGLLLALASPELEVLGVTATFGCHKDVEVTARNAERLLAAAGRSDVPVYRGSPFPTGKTHPPSWDGSFVHGEDGFGDLSMDHTACTPAEHGGLSAAEFIAQSARRLPGEVALLCFSALTNVGHALAIEPRLPSLLHSLVVMGGALHKAGNASPLAEANFLHDSLAASLVLHAFSREGGCPLILAPLDLTDHAITSPAAISQLREGGKAGRMFAAAWPVYQAAYCRLASVCEGTPLHDAHTVGYLVAPQLYNHSETVHFEVVVDYHGPAVSEPRTASPRRTRTARELRCMTPVTAYVAPTSRCQ